MSARGATKLSASLNFQNLLKLQSSPTSRRYLPLISNISDKYFYFFIIFSYKLTFVKHRIANSDPKNKILSQSDSLSGTGSVSTLIWSVL